MGNHYWSSLFKKRDSVTEEARYVFTSVSERHLNFEQYLEIIKRVWRSKSYQALPRWAQSYVQGYVDGLYKCHISDNLEWRVYLDGKHMPGREVPTGRWVDVVPDMGAHFWKGTDIMFNVPDGMKETEE